MGTAVLLLCLLQLPDLGPGHQAAADARKREAALRQIPASAGHDAAVTRDANLRDSASAREQEFVTRFNRLIEALVDFAEDYKTQQSVNVRKAKQVRRAWVELEKFEAVFQDEKKK